MMMILLLPVGMASILISKMPWKSNFSLFNFIDIKTIAYHRNLSRLSTILNTKLMDNGVGYRNARTMLCLILSSLQFRQHRNIEEGAVLLFLLFTVVVMKRSDKVQHNANCLHCGIVRATIHCFASLSHHFCCSSRIENLNQITI